MEEEITYEVQSFDDREGINEWRTLMGPWDTLAVFKTKQEAEKALRRFKRVDKIMDIKEKYRIVKITIKKEVLNLYKKIPF
jgi:hypothetical protein